jgi:DNA-binding SARP family transcriptional activator/TolB-like protein/Flp pilus assembly protein TadD
MLRLRVFGGVAIERNGVPVTETAELHKALALLALVAASGERGVSRDQLAAFLWPESDSEHARSALSQTLYTLRKQLAEPEIFVGTRTLRLNPTAIGSDLRDFERALEHDDPEAAVGFYSDPFLQGFFLPNCLELERWIDAERADLLQRWAAAIESLARRATERGDHASAVRWWRRLTATEPGNSRPAAALVEALAAAGDRAGALQAARSHEEFLRSEFDAPPDPAVSALVEKIRRGGGTVEVANGGDTPSRSDAEPRAPRRPNERSVGQPAVTARLRLAGVATLLGFIVILTIWRLTAARGGTTHDSLVTSRSDSHSVAVLYFDNLSPDSADAYLADGLTEEIISRLGKVPSLQVKRTSREAVRRLRDSFPDYLPALGRALGVQSVLSGNVRKGSDRIRVTVQLSNASTGFRSWSDDYNPEPGDLLAIETEIASSVAKGIAGYVSPNDSIRLQAKPTANAEAHEHFLQGNYYLALRTGPADARAIFERSIFEYQHAVRLDPLYARAHARMAYAYGLCSNWRQPCIGLSRDTLIARGFAAADAALKIDSTTSDAWLALATLRVEKDPQRLEGTTEAIDRAVALDPTSAEGHHIRGFLHMLLGNDSIARAAYNAALIIEPIRPQTLRHLSSLNRNRGRYDEALKSIDSAVNIAIRPDPEFYLQRGTIRRMLGDTAGARRDAEFVLRVDSTPLHANQARIELALLQLREGDSVKSRQLVETAVHDFSGARTTGNLDGGVALSLATGLLAIGENGRAIEFLERVEPSAVFWYSINGRDWDSIRAEPRFQELCRRTRPRRAHGACG